MNICKINGKYYLVDFTKFEFYSISTSKTFTFGECVKVSELKEYLNKYDV